MAQLLLKGITTAERSKSILEMKKMLDCTFVVGEKKEEIKASRIHLIIASPKFEAMFLYEEMTNQKPIIIEKVNPKDFKKLIELSLCPGSGDFESREEASQICELSHKYSMADIKELCANYLKPKSVDEFFHSLEIGALYELETLLSSCEKIVLSNGRKIIHASRFLTLSPKAMKIFLQMKNMGIDSELELFNAIMKWASSECSRQSLPKEPTYLRKMLDISGIIEHIRFLAMPVETFRRGPYKSGILKENESCAIFSNIGEKTISNLPNTISRETGRRNNFDGSILSYHVAKLYIKGSLHHTTQPRNNLDEYYMPASGGVLHMSSYCVEFLITANRPLVIIGVSLCSQNKPEDVVDDEYDEKVIVTLLDSKGKEKCESRYDSYYKNKVKYDSEIYVSFPSDPVTTFFQYDLIQFKIEYKYRGNYMQCTQNSSQYEFKQNSPYNTIKNIHYGYHRW